MTRRDVIVVGAGPNGLAAACALARAGLSTLLVEARSTPGGGVRTSELTLPKFRHDVCSAVHPLGIASPFFRSIGLDRRVRWIDPPAALAHVLDESTVITLERSVDETAEQLGADADAYRALMTPFVGDAFDPLLEMILGPLRAPSDPALLARFGWRALKSMRRLAERFEEPAARALLGGIAAHAMVPLESRATASFALVLAAAGHAVGWPVARGGSQAITDALVAIFREAGGELELDHTVERLEDLPPARAYVLDVTPRQLLAIAGDHLPASYRARLRRFRYGPGVFKIDWALDGAVPWRNPACARAATVHLSGDLYDVTTAESLVHHGGISAHPFVLFVQPSRFDPMRAPPGKHTAWAYCHVPHGSRVDATRAIEAQVERYAPGFKRLVLARSTMNAREMEAYNPNYVGGDINGGISNLQQLFFRPVARRDPYATPSPNIFLCSSSTPPGAGVHGMCGYWAAESVLAKVFARRLRAA